jgi:hypothetical protein
VSQDLAFFSVALGQAMPGQAGDFSTLFQAGQFLHNSPFTTVFDTPRSLF